MKERFLNKSLVLLLLTLLCFVQLSYLKTKKTRVIM